MEKKLQHALNEQIKNELYSSYLYLSMAAYCESENLPGLALWMKIQAKEEAGHGMKIFEFLVNRGVRVILQVIPQPPIDFSSPQDIFEKTLEHEKKVTNLIHKLYETSKGVKDNSAQVFLQWLITEQVEEEKNATHILGMLQAIKPKSAGMIMLDKELGKREG